ncbi:MAG TPA: hypothetical protein PKA82_13015 [Pyrinomonadaceae bacterium]|nr:hypothetical protein [Pyrinomonadaceae bacterium]
MYRRSKFNEILLEIRETMSTEAEFDVQKFVEPLLAKDTVAANVTSDETTELVTNAD